MRTFLWIPVVCVFAASAPSLARTVPPAPAAARQALAILTHLDLNSFPNSTGPRRRASAHTPADYGLTKVESFSDGWAQVSQPDGSWVMTAFVQSNGDEPTAICLTDAAVHAGTYHATELLRVKRGSNSLWSARQIADQYGCNNDPAFTPASRQGFDGAPNGSSTRLSVVTPVRATEKR